MPVSINGSSHSNSQAGANLMPSSQPIGLAAPDGLGGFLAQASEFLTLTTTQWDAIIEGGLSSTGLTPGAWYYAGCDSGKITTGVPVPGESSPEPSTSSSVGARVGFAVSATQMLIRIGDVPLTLNLPNNGAALGMPVTIDQPASVTVLTPAAATSRALAEVAGIVAYSNASDTNVVAFTSGMILELTTVQWDARTGGSGGLSPGEAYYLSATSGGIVASTPPSGSGDFTVKIGAAISATMLAIEIGEPIPSTTS
jgi:hypothetical protein